MEVRCVPGGQGHQMCEGQRPAWPGQEGQARGMRQGRPGEVQSQPWEWLLRPEESGEHSLCPERGRDQLGQKLREAEPHEPWAGLLDTAAGGPCTVGGDRALTSGAGGVSGSVHGGAGRGGEQQVSTWSLRVWLRERRGHHTG